MANPLSDFFAAPSVGVPASSIEAFKRIASMMQGAQNPQAALSMFAQKNPQMAQIMQMCSGKNPKDVFFSECKRRGLNPDEVIAQLGIH